VKIIARILPFLSWIRISNWSTIKDDVLSGLTVALVLIPQSMAYAQLAGLPPHYGLYASFLPPAIAALFGSSRQLATGPVAVVSLMTSATLEPLATAGSEQYVAYAVLLAVLVGTFQFLLGVLRLGVVVNFLSHPVVNGFTNAAAIIIATSQLDKIFGVGVEKAEHHYETVARVVSSAFEWTHLPTLGMAVLAFSIMVVLRRLNPRIPNVLIAVGVTTAISASIGYQRDVVVAVNDIDSSRLEELVGEFDEAVVLQRHINELRSEGSALSDEIASSTDSHRCQRCHELRPPQELESETEMVAGTGRPGRTLVLHHMAGLLEGQSSDLKEEISTIRSQLRSLVFLRVTDAGGPEFFERSRLPAGAATDGRRWRLKLGNNPLDPEALVMVGGGAVVGTIPSGLPSATVPKLDMRIIPKLLSATIIISLLGFMEAISIAKAMAAKTGQRLDPNQELIGQGLANMVGSVGQTYPVSGSFSRSAVNLQAGGKTGLSSVITSMAVIIVLLFFTPLLYHLPQAVLAAVIMMAVIGLVNVSGFVHAWRAQRYDGIISVITFIATLAFAPHLDKGIMIGVVLSLGVFLHKNMRPKVISLSRHDDASLRAALMHDLDECKYVDVVRFDGPLFFANASYLEDQINERLQAKRDLRHIIIVSNAITDIDASGEETLSLLVDRVRSAGVEISFSGVNESVMTVLERTHLIARIGHERIFHTMEQAIQAVHASAHRNGHEERCPLTTACRRMERAATEDGGS
jgi:MFS superfamily sulfate permease-like transporter